MSAPAASRTSLWAVASLACGLLPCPPLCLIAPLLGVVGLIQIRVRPAITGRRLAIGGIVLGMFASGLWSGAFIWWHLGVRRPLLEGPRAALVAGFAGDIEAFRAGFHEPATSEEASAFLAELAQRYGTFLDIAQDRAPRAGARVQVDPDRPIIRYRLRFVARTVGAEAEFVRVDDAEWPMVLRWGWLTIHDAERGDLTYPVSARGERGDGETW